LFHFYFLL